MQGICLIQCLIFEKSNDYFRKIKLGTRWKYVKPLKWVQFNRHFTAPVIPDVDELLVQKLLLESRNLKTSTFKDKISNKNDNIIKFCSLVETTVVWYALVRPLMTNLSADFGHIILTEKFYLRSLTACFCGFQNEILYSWHSFNKKCPIELLLRPKHGMFYGWWCFNFTNTGKVPPILFQNYKYIKKDRPLSFLKTVHIHLILPYTLMSKDQLDVKRSVWAHRTVHVQISGLSILGRRPL